MNCPESDSIIERVEQASNMFQAMKKKKVERKDNSHESHFVLIKHNEGPFVLKVKDGIYSRKLLSRWKKTKKRYVNAMKITHTKYRQEFSIWEKNKVKADYIFFKSFLKLLKKTIDGKFIKENFETIEFYGCNRGIISPGTELDLVIFDKNNKELLHWDGVGIEHYLFEIMFKKNLHDFLEWIGFLSNGSVDKQRSYRRNLLMYR